VPEVKSSANVLVETGGSPPPVRRAVIDVGTNSVKLLVADAGGGLVHPVYEDSEQTRLGAGFYETHRLQPQSIAKTASAVASFVTQARQMNAVSTRVLATSAARDALNQTDLVSAIESASGLKVEIISGEREADLAFRGVTTIPEFAQQPLMLLDVGGGSTEFILGQGEHRHFCRSFPLGVLRLFEKFPPADPPTARQLAECRRWVKEFIHAEILPPLTPALKRESSIDAQHRPALLVGTGGTATILARMQGRLGKFSRERIEGLRLQFDQVREHVERLWKLPLSERKQTVGLPKKRADVILTGVVIYEAVMENLGYSELCISTRGLRFAAVMEPV
jgi:exopolyphosphatase / guanosine-5'-triphosphate,3'-diphosphate pyrophosphatase